MNYLRDEKVISIKEWIYAIFSKWRSILAVSFIAFISVLFVNIIGAIPYSEELAMSIIVSAVLKQSVLVAIVSALVLVLFYGIRFVFSDVVKTETEMKMTLNIDVLGDISERMYKKNRWLDRKLKGYIGLKQAECIEMSIERVGNIIKAKFLENNNELVKIAVVSSVSDVCAAECVDKLKELLKDKVDLVMAGDVMVSPEAIKIVSDMEFVILAESVNVSKYTVINDTCKQMNGFDKKIVGIVLVDK